MSQFDFDDEKLAAYLEQQIDGFSGPLTSSKFAGGQSNPTFRLDAKSGSYVLRRKPPGQLLKGAHAVDREYRVISSLNNTNVPVAKTYHLCEDDSIIGSMFYVMECVQGRVLWAPSLPDSSPTERSQIYAQMNDVLAKLHSVDVDAIGMKDFGKPGDYYARQINTWTKQYRASETVHIQEMEALITWLSANQPEDDGKTSIVHGDYRIDNLMFAAETSEILAILDWELSTIGHPYADLAYQCMQYHTPHTNTHLRGLAGLDLAQLGIPNEQEYVAMYCKQMGLSEIPNWDFYLKFSFFRLAAICQGIEKRSQDGNASSDKAKAYGALTQPLADIAMSL